MSSLSIPLLLVDDEEFQALEFAIAAAESTLRVSKKPKICSSETTLLSSSSLKSESFSVSTHARPEASQGNADSSSATLYGDGGCLLAHPRLKSPRKDASRLHVDCGDVGSCSKGSFLRRFSSTLGPETDELSRLQGKGDTKSTISRRLASWPCPAEGPTRNPRSITSTLPIYGDEKTSLAHHISSQEASDAENRFQWGLAPSTCHKAVVVKSKLQYIQFKGQIKYCDTVLDAENAAIQLLREVEAQKAVCGGPVPLGFDAEWRVIWQKGFQNKQGAERQKVAVLQLCLDAKSCNVFHIVYTGIPSPLKSILEDPSVLKVGLGADGDARKLFTDYNMNVKGVKDLHSLANAKLGMGRSWSLASLTAELLGKQLDKDPKIRCGDWEVHPLSNTQLQYAATDAFVSLFLFQALSSLPNR